MIGTIKSGTIPRQKMYENRRINMNRKELSQLGIEDDKIDDILKLHGKSINPLKAEQDNLKVKNVELEGQVDQYKTDYNKLKNESGDIDSLKNQISELETELSDEKKNNTVTKKVYETRLSLNDVKAHNPDTVMKLIDMDKVELEDDEIKGLDDQIEKLKESDAYLFKQESTSDDKGTDEDNKGTGADDDKGTGDNDFEYVGGSTKKGNRNPKSTGNEEYGKQTAERLFGKKEEE